MSIIPLPTTLLEIVHISQRDWLAGIDLGVAEETRTLIAQFEKLVSYPVRRQLHNTLIDGRSLEARLMWHNI